MKALLASDKSVFSKYLSRSEYTTFVRKTDYPSDLTDQEWTLLEPHLPVKSDGRPRAWPLRLTVDGIFYLLRTGCAWRQLPLDYPPWQTVYTTFRRWKKDGTWQAVHTALRESLRVAVGRDPTPSASVMDSQSVKTTEKGGLLASGPSVLTATKRSKAANATSWWIRRAC